MATAEGILDVVDAAYRVALNDNDWLAGIATACRPLLDQGFGLCAFTFEFRRGSAPQIGNARMLGVPDGLAELYPTVFARMETSVKLRPFARGPCTTASQMMGLRGDFKFNPLMQPYAQRFGMMDSIWITAAEPSGYGVGLHAGRPQIGWASPKTVALWSRLGAHLSAALRLRKAGRARGEEAAIFDAHGQLQHASDAAQESVLLDQLRHAVAGAQQLRALPSAERDSNALSLLKGLVAARWSLIDRFDRDGKRYIVACTNEPEPPAHEALTLRERQVVGYAALGHDNKVVAYDLGISHSTVRVLMARAASKLGLRTREDLIATYRRHHAGVASPASDPALSSGVRP